MSKLPFRYQGSSVKSQSISLLRDSLVASAGFAYQINLSNDRRVDSEIADDSKSIREGQRKTEAWLKKNEKFMTTEEVDESDLGQVTTDFKQKFYKNLMQLTTPLDCVSSDVYILLHRQIPNSKGKFKDLFPHTHHSRNRKNRSNSRRQNLYCDSDEGIAEANKELLMIKAAQLNRIYLRLGGSMERLNASETIQMLFSQFSEKAQYQKKYEERVEDIMADLFNLSPSMRSYLMLEEQIIKYMRYLSKELVRADKDPGAETSRGGPSTLRHTKTLGLSSKKRDSRRQSTHMKPFENSPNNRESDYVGFKKMPVPTDSLHTGFARVGSVTGVSSKEMPKNYKYIN